ncbi:MAG: hypothetical protein AAFX54_04870 [Pseudomonadota bacterium]
MIEIAISLLLAADTEPVQQKACYASRGGNSDQVLLIANGIKGELSAKGLRQVECPNELQWSADAALKQCAILAQYDVEQSAAYKEHHGVAPNEVCDEGRMAAGLRLRGQD